MRNTLAQAQRLVDKYEADNAFLKNEYKPVLLRELCDHCNWDVRIEHVASGSGYCCPCFEIHVLEGGH